MDILAVRLTKDRCDSNNEGRALCLKFCRVWLRCYAWKNKSMSSCTQAQFDNACIFRFPASASPFFTDSYHTLPLAVFVPFSVLITLSGGSSIFVVTAIHIHVYEFTSKPRPVTVVDTGANPRGLIAVSLSRSAGASSTVLAFPAADQGSVQISVLATGSGRTVAAHSGALSFLVLDLPAALLATASAKGTCIRLFKVESGELFRELRRGIDPSEIRQYVVPEL